MSIQIFQCPIGNSLPEFEDPDCPAAYGNIVAMALQFDQGDSPTFTQSTIGLAATWITLLAASNETGVRIVQTGNFTTTPGEAITEGGNDQTTFRGRFKIKGVGYSTGRFELQGVAPAYAKAFTEFTKFSALPNQRSMLRAFLITDEGYILHGEDYNGIEIWGILVQDAAKGGSFKPEENFAVTFGFDYGWSLEQFATKPSFDALSLRNP